MCPYNNTEKTDHIIVGVSNNRLYEKPYMNNSCISAFHDILLLSTMKTFNHYAIAQIPVE